ncbi:MAG: hypothetical protein FJW34_23605, partial [Acidobacteria bacterium]|nr:hypothetical protein [Acidobacteriota bacterium]
MDDLTESWRSFRQEVETRSRRLAEKVTAVWNEVRSMSDAVAFALSSESLGENPPGTIEALEQLFDESGRRWLLEPVERCLRIKPLQRILSAIQDYETALENLARRLPAAAKVSGRELVALLEPARGAGWRRYWRRWQSSPRSVPLRSVVSGHLERRNLARAPLDGAFQLVVAQACLGLLEPWDIVQHERLGVWSGAPPEGFSRERQRQRWERDRARQAVRAAELLAGYRHWTEAAAEAAAGAALGRSSGPPERASRTVAARRQRHRSYWSRQQRAVQSLLNLEVALLTVSCEATRASRASLDSLALEHEELLRELDAVVAWLEEASAEEGAKAVPPSQAHLLSTEERLTGWLRHMAAQARARLPATVEAIEP